MDVASPILDISRRYGRSWFVLSTIFGCSCRIFCRWFGCFENSAVGPRSSRKSISSGSRSFSCWRNELWIYLRRSNSCFVFVHGRKSNHRTRERNLSSWKLRSRRRIGLPDVLPWFCEWSKNLSSMKMFNPLFQSI